MAGDGASKRKTLQLSHLALLMEPGLSPLWCKKDGFADNQTYVGPPFPRLGLKIGRTNAIWCTLR